MKGPIQKKYHKCISTKAYKSSVFECLQKLQDYCELLTPRKESENVPEKNVTCNLC